MKKYEIIREKSGKVAYIVLDKISMIVTNGKNIEIFYSGSSISVDCEDNEEANNSVMKIMESLS